MKKFLPFICICSAAVLWGSISVCFRPLIAVGFTSVQIVFLRVTIAAIGMALYIAFTDPSLFCIRLKDIRLFLGSGILSLAFFNVCYFQAIETLSVSIAAALLYTAPVFVMLFSAVLFREKLTLKKLAAVILTVIGCLFVTGVFEQSSTIHWIGILFGIGSGIGYAFYSIFGTLALQRYRTQTVTFYTFLAASFSILPFCKLADMVSVVQSESIVSIGYSLAIGIGVCLLPYWLYTKGLEQIRPSNAAVIATIEPIVAAVIGFVVFQENFSFWTFVGILLIVSSICILNVTRIKKSPRS